MHLLKKWSSILRYWGCEFLVWFLPVVRFITWTLMYSSDYFFSVTSIIKRCDEAMEPGSFGFPSLYLMFYFLLHGPSSGLACIVVALTHTSLQLHVKKYFHFHYTLAQCSCQWIMMQALWSYFICCIGYSIWTHHDSKTCSTVSLVISMRLLKTRNWCWIWTSRCHPRSTKASI